MFWRWGLEEDSAIYYVYYTEDGATESPAVAALIPPTRGHSVWGSKPLPSIVWQSAKDRCTVTGRHFTGGISLEAGGGWVVACVVVRWAHRMCLCFLCCWNVTSCGRIPLRVLMCAYKLSVLCFHKVVLWYKHVYIGTPSTLWLPMLIISNNGDVSDHCSFLV